MRDLRRLGAAAALVCGATYVFGFAVLVGVLLPAGFGAEGADAEAALAVVADNRGMVRLWYVVIYIVNAVALAVLVAALAERIAAAGQGALGRLTRTFGTVWATLVLGAGMVMNVGLSQALPLWDAGDPDAVLLWQVADLVENGLGGGNEIAGGAWALALGIAGLASGALSRPLSVLSVVVGGAGLATLLPGAAGAGGAVFGLGFILWFFWTGAELALRPGPAAARA